MVTSTGGASHLFTGDGNWTFLFVDTAGNTGSAVAVVSGIDKLSPVATNVSYSPSTATNNDVVVTLMTNEPIQQPTNWS
ncbi:MAG: hypothetical protein LBP53_04190 [Candidatus Peribacteria bacterium]|nr:hypothetical protein [Candidatus Peribacteria bacterium]